MHCPICGQQQISDEIRFCSRCGFPLAGVAELVANDGLVPGKRSRRAGILGSAGSARRRGVKQGAFIFLLNFLVVPVLVMIALAMEMEPYLPVIGMVLVSMSAILRMVFAVMFESAAPESATAVGPASLPGSEKRGALPSSQSFPASAYTSPTAGSWRDTNDLQRERGSITDSTTKLLEREERDQ